MLYHVIFNFLHASRFLRRFTVIISRHSCSLVVREVSKFMEFGYLSNNFESENQLPYCKNNYLNYMGENHKYPVYYNGLLRIVFVFFVIH